MGLVFVALVVISYLIRTLRIVSNIENRETKKVDKLNEEPKVVKEPLNTSANENDDEELVAVITAAIAATLSRSSENIIIRNIKRISQDTPAWAKAGRQEQIYNKL